MISYFPFESDTYAMTMGVQPLGERPLIEVDTARYTAELNLKQAILAADPRYYSQASPGSEAAQWEVLALVLGDLAQHRPDLFALERRGDRWSWRNCLLCDTTAFSFGDASTLPLAPLDWVGRQVQEDLLLLAGDERAGFPLVAGQLCFANMWCLDEKIGLSFMDVHAPVALFRERLGRSSSLLMARIKESRPVWRLNWSIVTNDRLDLSPRFAEENRRSKLAVRAENAGATCFLRVERQGLARLPASGAVLFSIHTYLTPFGVVAADTERAKRVLGVLRSAPDEVLVYKGIAPFAEPLCAYLERMAVAEG